jgi:histidine phosphotransfer protein HptB
VSDPFFERLAERFRQRAAEDAVRLRAALAADEGDAVRTIAHRLAGTAGTFGFDGIGTLAAALEEARGPDCEDAARALLDALDALA